jgi:hypothetical protein
MQYCLIPILLYLCLSSCNGQDKSNIEISNKIIYSKDTSNTKQSDEGIIYLSTDNGINWSNASSGLPQKISIGLGGIAVSETTLGVATKEYGVYYYNFNDSTWVNIPTANEIIESNIGSLAIFKNIIYVGTQHKGVFCSNDNGKTWLSLNNGLNNQTIRRFVAFEHLLYVCTNDGFYSLNENLRIWQLEYGNNALQVNGATYFKGNFFIGTNKGIYKKEKDNNWTSILPNHSVHNISSDNNEVYAMTYNEFLLSSKDGINWHSIQDGLPENLYTFNVINQNNTLFAGQWDGIYSRTKFSNTWISSSKGIPEKFAVTNLKSINGVLVITTSERKLKGEMNSEK